MDQSKVLLTGGAGYVGSHSLISLLQSGYNVHVIDNMSNTALAQDGTKKPESLKRVEDITGKSVSFSKVDLLNSDELENVFKSNRISSVIHFAALKAVGESCAHPLKYYKNNITGTLNLIEVMEKYECRKIVFSSSATVYGNPIYLPIDEKHPVGNCTNPYGQTKYMIEQIINDVAKADKRWKGIMLRYFNPVGAHDSGKIGEDPLGEPNNLMPYIAQVAVQKREFLSIYGNDYETRDGTGIRDYIHVMDLAEGHVAALKKLDEDSFSGWKAYNLGTGKGLSVLELIKAFREASGKEIAYKIANRRAGDISTSFASCELAENELNWRAKRDVNNMCLSTYKWQSKNPNGFKKLE